MMLVSELGASVCSRTTRESIIEIKSSIRRLLLPHPLHLLLVK